VKIIDFFAECPKKHSANLSALGKEPDSGSDLWHAHANYVKTKGGRILVAFCGHWVS
jgi:hypothetical protein